VISSVFIFLLFILF